MKVPRPIDHERPRRRRGRALVAAAISTLMAGAVVAPSLLTDTAGAAGSGIVNVVITPFDVPSSSPLTDISNDAPNAQVSYKVQFSCGTAACNQTDVAFTATPPAPANPVQTLPGEAILRYSSLIQPAGITATVTGDDTTGRTFHLGNLAAGASGTFTVTYLYQQGRTREIPPAAWLPDGTQVPMTATISSTTATAPASSTANVTWHRKTASPTVGMFASGTVKPDTPVALKLTFGAGNVANSNGLPVASSTTPVSSYQVVAHLPAEANISSADLGGVVDNGAHTVTWTEGAPGSPAYAARAAWGDPNNGDGSHAVNDGAVPGDGVTFGPRTVNVTFPHTSFPGADASGCNFSADVTTTSDASVVYLDGTVKTATATSPTKVACSSPFGGMTAPTKAIVGGQTTSTGDGVIDSRGTGAADDVYAVNVPAAGITDAGSRAWRITIANRGNVDGTAVIDEPNLSQDHIKVYEISPIAYEGDHAGWQATVDWVDNTGAHGSQQLAVGDDLTAAPGRWFTSATTTAPIAKGRVLRTDTTDLSMTMDYRFTVDSGALPLIGQQRTNTADVSISYPADADGDGSDDAYTDTTGAALPTRAVGGPVSRDVQYSQPAPILSSGFIGGGVVDGGGNLVPGKPVTFKVTASTQSVYPGVSIRPQLVFVAPLGWDTIPGSASIAANGTGWANPAPSAFHATYGTKLVSGVPRSVAVVTWDDPVTLDSTLAAETWPTISVKATPGSLAPTGSASFASVWAFDQSGTWTAANGTQFFTNAHTVRPGTSRVAFSDTSDVDEDGTNPETYVTFSDDVGPAVAASDSVKATKELCVPDATQADGCSWTSDTSTPAQLFVDAGTVKYRVSIVNSGNTTLHGVVAYDVLPYPGDTGLLAGAASRGSQLDMTLAGVDSQSAGVTVASSASTNPARPEVNPTATGTVSDWDTVTVGDHALRITVAGDLAPAAVKQVVFDATIDSSAAAGQQACNNAAVDSAETLPAEPASVCVLLKALPNPAPTASITSPANGSTIDFGVTTHAAFACHDTPESDLTSCVAKDENGITVAQGSAVNTTTSGSHTITVTATDSAGQTATASTTYTVTPNPPPTVAISEPIDGSTVPYGSTLRAQFACQDSPPTDITSCLAKDEDGHTLSLAQTLDTTIPGSHTVTLTAVDSAGQTAVTTTTYTVLPKPNVPPTASITTPPDGAVYFQGQHVPAAYTCADPDGSVASCVGNVPVGSNVDTATLGSKTFTVTATDDQGATGSASTTYAVVATKGVCRGTALSLNAIGLGVANGPTTPCVTALDQVLKANVFVITPGIPLLGIAPNQVTVGVLKGASQSGPGSAAAQAEVASVKIQLLGQTIEATGLTSSASSVLSGCASPAAVSGLSSILTLTINGKPVANLNQSITVPLIVGALALNEHAVVGNGVTQTALHLNVLGLVDLALGQSVAGATC